MIKECLNCKKEFKHPPSHKRKYCSQKCMGSGQTFRQTMTKCEWCGMAIYQKRMRIKKYCSKLCRSEALRSMANDRNRRYCQHCDKMFIRGSRKWNQKYCGIVCANRAKFYMPEKQKFAYR